MDTPQIKIEKLLKYGKKQLTDKGVETQATTFREVLDDISNVKAEEPTQYGAYNIEVIEKDDGTQELHITDAVEKPVEYPINPTWWDIPKILANDTREYTHKVIMLIYAVEDETLLHTTQTNDARWDAVETSDGSFYLRSDGTNVTHTWDKTKDKPCYVNGVEVYKTRYIICYSNSRPYAMVPINMANSTIWLHMGFEYNHYYDSNNPTIEEVSHGALRHLRALEISPNNIKLSQGAAQLFYNHESLRFIHYPIDTSEVISFANMFGGCISLITIPELNTSNGVYMNNMFSGCANLRFVPQLDLTNCTIAPYLFENCSKLKKIDLINANNLTDGSSLFDGCRELIELNFINSAPKNIARTSRMFYSCGKLPLIDLSDWDMSKTASANYMFYGCVALSEIKGTLDMPNLTSTSNMFYGCKSLTEIKGTLDLLNATNVSNMFDNCQALTSVTLKNIKKALKIGSGTSWGHLLTLDTLINTIKELWDYSGGTTTYKLTIGSANLEKIANTYVKLITPTEEQIAADPNITSKLPCVVCESTEEGAMLLTDYAFEKGWTIV